MRVRCRAARRAPGWTPTSRRGLIRAPRRVSPGRRDAAAAGAHAARHDPSPIRAPIPWGPRVDQGREGSGRAGASLGCDGERPAPAQAQAAPTARARPAASPVAPMAPAHGRKGGAPPPPPIVGMGEHVPLFMRRPVPQTRGRVDKPGEE